MHKRDQMKLEHGLGSFYAIRSDNISGLFYSSRDLEKKYAVGI